jgi:hypothetical protein
MCKANIGGRSFRFGKIRGSVHNAVVTFRPAPDGTHSSFQECKLRVTRQSMQALLKVLVNLCNVFVLYSHIVSAVDASRKSLLLIQLSKLFKIKICLRLVEQCEAEGIYV